MGSKFHRVGCTSISERLWCLGLAYFSGLVVMGKVPGRTYGGMTQLDNWQFVIGSFLIGIGETSLSIKNELFATMRNFQDL